MTFFDKHLELKCHVVNEFVDNNTSMIVYKYYDVSKWVYKCITKEHFNINFEMNVFHNKAS